MTADITKDIVENDLSYKEAEELIGIALRNKFHSNGSKFTIKPHNILEYNSIGAIKCKQKSILTTKRNENNYTDHDESLEIAGEWFKKNPGKMKWALTDLNKTLYLHDPDRIKAEEYAREETKKRKNIKENKA